MGNTIWAGQVLRVDLTSRHLTVHPTSDWAEDAFGGRGIGQWTLFREVEPGLDAYDPSNLICFGAGPLVGTLAPAACRLSVDTKNPYTGGVGSSNAGGHFAPELKYAGFDAVIVTGRASAPVYLWIHDGSAEILDGKDLWGLDTWQTETVLRERHRDPDVRVAVIGPAGERLVRGGCIMVDRARAAGRCGAGAVMGSKLLKGIAVRGTGELRAADPNEFLRHAERCKKKLMESRVLAEYRAGGSMRVAGAGGPSGMIPQAVRNNQDEFWPLTKSRAIYEPLVRGDYEVRKLGCFNCPISCSRFLAVAEGPYAGSRGQGFQINSANAFGSNLDIDCLPAIIEAHNYCNRMGLDVDMAGACLAFAFEAFERGHLNAGEANGLALNWGNHEAAMQLLHAMVERRGLGDLLAEGVDRASKALGRGSEAYAMHVKGADINEEGMRQLKAWTFGIVLSVRGGGHLDGAPIARSWMGHEDLARELFGDSRPWVSGDYRHQARVVAWYENYKSVIDMLGICYFASMWMDPEAVDPADLAALLSAGVGLSFTAEELLHKGERLINVEKAFNTIHAGLTRRDDQPPKRLMEDPVLTGPSAGELIDSREWERMLDEYYEERGWDPESGLQTRLGLERLSLQEVISKLTSRGMLR